MGWSEQELEFLRNSFKDKTHQEMANILHKTASCVRGMCNSMGLLKKKRKVWDDHDINFLIDNHNNYTCLEIANILGRTERSVQHKFADLSLKKESKKPQSVFIGQKINRLTVLDTPYPIRVGKEQKIKWKVKCQCECGKIGDHWLACVSRESTKSCGCYIKQLASKHCKTMNQKYTDGIIQHKLYIQWGRIKGDVSSEWDNYESFYNWALPNYDNSLSAIKIDSKKPHGPENTYFDRIGSKSSIPEVEINQWLDSLGLVFKKDRNILDGLEIDLYNDDLKIGIEYCGLYWHSESMGRDRKFHYGKYKKCKDKNIRLITIFSDEWINRTTHVRNFIASAVGKCDTKIFARKCSIRQVDKQIGMDFVEAYHIQGSKKKALVYFGIYNGETMVGCLSLAHHHRVGRDSLVLDRMCFSDNVSVVGGASRLLNAARGWAKKEGYGEIISWSDNRWSTGNVYEKMGFNLDGELGPDYSYIKISNPSVRIAKQAMTKKKTNCPKDKTELEWATELGFSRIWDCGKKRWVTKV